MRKLLFSLVVAVACANLSGCGYNKLQNQDEAVKAAWSAVINQYQRRADLVPNLVNTVKGYAAQEERVLVEVTEARAKATSIQLTPELINDPAAFAKFQAAQGQLSSALKSLLATVENYPNLKSDGVFRDLMVQLEGTENRIAVARRDYILAVKDYNLTLKTFPSVLWATFWFRSNEPYANFTVDEDKMQPPKVDFGTKQGG